MNYKIAEPSTTDEVIIITTKEPELSTTDEVRGIIAVRNSRMHRENREKRKNGREGGVRHICNTAMKEVDEMCKSYEVKLKEMKKAARISKRFLEYANSLDYGSQEWEDIENAITKDWDGSKRTPNEWEHLRKVALNINELIAINTLES